MSLTLYGLKNCDTCKKARAWLAEHAVAHTFVDYREQPVDPATLQSWAGVLGWEKLVNRASTSWRALSDDEKAAATDAQWLALIARQPALVKRPVVVQDGAVSVGFSVKAFAERFGG